MDGAGVVPKVDGAGVGQLAHARPGGGAERLGELVEAREHVTQAGQELEGELVAVSLGDVLERDDHDIVVLGWTSSPREDDLASDRPRCGLAGSRPGSIRPARNGVADTRSRSRSPSSRTITSDSSITVAPVSMARTTGRSSQRTRVPSGR